MKIYNVINKIDGLGNSDFDYEAVYASGYSAGYDAGYASVRCYKNEYLTIEALEDGIFKLDNYMDYYGGWSAHTRLNGGEWEEISYGTTDYSLSQGDIMEIKGVYTGTTLYAKLTLSLKSKVYGNILSLRDGDDFVGDDKEAIQGNGLFSNSVGLVDASNLVLPGEKPYYVNMFNGCTSLTGAPELTATTLVGYSYQAMFHSCTSLTSAPELPATNLANRCYRQMFQNCTSLTGGTTRLPATVLFDRCYVNMFYNCTSLTEAPELSATNLAEECCEGMFGNCTSLTTAPELPATNLARACYYRMFSGCTSLVSAPELPATTLADRCYENMFAGCTSLTIAQTELPATKLSGANSCYRFMFAGCTSLTTAPNLPATTLADGCYEHMFDGCTSLTTAPELPATELQYLCYFLMFYGCTSLTTAPELPATTLADSSYYGMFNNCSSLNHIKCLATDVSAFNSTAVWVTGVAQSGTFIKAAGMNDWPAGKDGIPNGWTVVDAE